MFLELKFIFIFIDFIFIVGIIEFRKVFISEIVVIIFISFIVIVNGLVEVVKIVFILIFIKFCMEMK